MARLSLSTRYPTSYHYPLFMKRASLFSLSLRQLKSYCRSRGNPSATGEYIRSISHPPVKTCAGAMTGSIAASRLSSTATALRRALGTPKAVEASHRSPLRMVSGVRVSPTVSRKALNAHPSSLSSSFSSSLYKVFSHRHRVTLLTCLLIEPD